ncbi:hypothetical protein FLT15_16375 [Paenibacillus thiaminolyticus]|uniref:hypothetical protein n=1 Tax=Paenibacillus thiaminolyticus TaxID=49283 RepID=UPI001162AA71|nr:hypothetical protein [Paenibacillus thiaminolyticus]NGP59882.1 hypothetical protein [Paenibacillus thiaminolyticus]
MIDVAAASDIAMMGNNVSALHHAAEQLGINLEETEEIAKEFGVTLEYIDDNGKISAKSLKELQNALQIYTKAVKDANKETTEELHQKAESIARQKQEISSVENLLKTYKAAKKGSQEWTTAQQELARMFPQLTTATE